MNKKTTPSHPSLPKADEHPLPTSGGLPHPSAETLAFLRAFARNYRVESQLPQGLQGIILG